MKEIRCVTGLGRASPKLAALAPQEKGPEDGLPVLVHYFCSKITHFHTENSVLLENLRRTWGGALILNLTMVIQSPPHADHCSGGWKSAFTAPLALEKLALIDVTVKKAVGTLTTLLPVLELAFVNVTITPAAGSHSVLSAF